MFVCVLCVGLAECKQKRWMMGAVCPGASPLSGRVIAGAGPVCQGNEAEVRDSRECAPPPQGTAEGGGGPAPPDRD